jgi:hypothetical protein
MLRTLIIVAALIIVFLLLRNRLRAGRASGAESPSSETTRMVQCLSCETYVPASEAVSDGDRQFCCQQHLRDWVNKS